MKVWILTEFFKSIEAHNILGELQFHAFHSCRTLVARARLWGAECVGDGDRIYCNVTRMNKNAQVFYTADPNPYLKIKHIFILTLGELYLRHSGFLTLQRIALPTNCTETWRTGKIMWRCRSVDSNVCKNKDTLTSKNNSREWLLTMEKTNYGRGIALTSLTGNPKCDQLIPDQSNGNGL